MNLVTLIFFACQSAPLVGKNLPFFPPLIPIKYRINGLKRNKYNMDIVNQRNEKN